MESHVPRAICCVLSILLSTIALSVLCNTQFQLFTHFTCVNSPVCLAGIPSTSFYVTSEIECGLACQRQNTQPQYCIGANYRQGENTCDMFYSITNTLNPSDFRKAFRGCQFIQVCESSRLLRASGTRVATQSASLQLYCLFVLACINLLTSLNFVL